MLKTTAQTDHHKDRLTRRKAQCAGVPPRHSRVRRTETALTQPCSTEPCGAHMIDMVRALLNGSVEDCGPEASRAAYGNFASIREVLADSFSSSSLLSRARSRRMSPMRSRSLSAPIREKRPRRTVCGPDDGAIAINEHTAPIQAEVLRALGMPTMAQRTHAAAGD
jgi:hypothetical protein